MEDPDKTCTICKKNVIQGEAFCTIREKGAQGINNVSRGKGHELNVNAGEVVHILCRKNYLRPVTKSASETDKKRETRSSSGGFNFKTDCFLCGQTVKEWEIKNKKHSYVSCKDKEVDTSIRKSINERGASDTWALEVKGRLEYINDLRSEDTIYHKTCDTKFRTGGKVQSTSTITSRKRGRPVDMSREAAFSEIASYLELNDNEQITISELGTMMDGMLPDSNAFTTKWLQSRLLSHFKDKIVITNINGKSNVVTFLETAAKILHDFNDYKMPKSEEEQKMRIIETAARILKNDIKRLELSKENYPSPTEIENTQQNVEYLPKSLKVLLTETFSIKDNDVKVASIGQAIMQQARPRTVVTPLQIGLAVQMHKHFGSRFLIDSLSSQGFCSSYTEVQKFERSAALFQGTDIPELDEVGNSCFIQHSADNVDHNIRTLDGLGTFHGMGIIVSVTPKLDRKCIIPRLKVVTSEDLLKVAHIESHILPSRKKSTLQFKNLPAHIIYENNYLTHLWSLTWLLNTGRPLWNGFMQNTRKGDHPGVASVLFMPMIDQKSTDVSCILSTMHFVCSQSKKYSKTPILTFDQPLYWKAMEIQLYENDNSNIKGCVLRLGGFHTCMSFMGSIGHLMQGSGLSSIFMLIYAENTVPYIINGKAVARATRGHLELYGCLMSLLIAKTFNFDVLVGNDNDEYIFQTNLPADIQNLSDLFKKVDANELTIDDLELTDSFKKVMNAINEFKSQLKLQSKTTQLWFQYIQTVEILCRFINAERSGNWMLHLQSIREMMPYFASSGHYLYAKSAYLYLQSMLDLHQTHPSVHQYFLDGLHVVRRSDRLWAGLSTDLVIEQVLMRSLKTSGGLTRGRGFTDIQRAIWLLSTPVTSEVNLAMQKFTGTYFETSDQHKETMVSRLKRDHLDALKITTYLNDRNPLTLSNDLINIHTGEVSDESVNVYQSNEIGSKLIDAMADASAFDISFKRKDMAKTMPTKHSITIENETVYVDPQLLFQRLIAVAGRSQEELEEAFTYELSTFPASIFNEDGLMREADKPKLAAAIWKSIGDSMSNIPPDTVYTLDGGAFVQRIPWNKGQTFENICNVYVNYVLKNYGKSTTVVFDGYHGPSTKDTTHIRRTKGRISGLVKLSLKNRLNVQKDTFLLNKINKQSFIVMLGEALERAEITVKHSDGDADLLVVQTALEIAKTNVVTIIGEDTDLLILLLHHKCLDSNAVYFTSERKSNMKDKPKIWDIEYAQRSLGVEVCNAILVIHAMLGCDTTSRIHTIGKASLFQKFQNDCECRRLVNILASPTEVKENILKAGENLLLLITGGKNEKTLDELRYTKYCKKVGSSKKAVSPEMLGPTSDAASLHTLRVYHQVQVWRGRNDLPLNEWGWVMKNKSVLPVTMRKPPAQANLLKVVKCSCRKDCTGRCTCRTLGVKCSTMCGTCRGVSCLNSDKCIEEEDDIDML